MKVAIEGCCHGELDKIYEIITKAEEKEGVKVDLLICCGDFQAVRDCGDLNCMAVPVKYRHMQTFYKYYSGAKKAPVLTIFIGGNHEASNYLWELGFGGWVAPNIYYLGYAGVVRYGGLRIAGLSGIYNEVVFRKNHFERPPYNNSTIRTAYHVRSCDVFRLKQLSGSIDIMLSHDWPLGIYHYGDKFLLLRLKPFLAEEMEHNTLGSPPAMELLKKHRPSFWFSAHLHVKFAAVYFHSLTAQEDTSEGNTLASAVSGEEGLKEPENQNIETVSKTTDETSLNSEIVLTEEATIDVGTSNNGKLETDGQILSISSEAQDAIMTAVTDDQNPTEDVATEGGATEDRVTEGGATEGGATEGGATEGGATEGGATEGGVTESGVAEDGAVEGRATEGGATEVVTTEGGATEVEATEDGVTGGVAKEGGVTEGGAAEAVAVESGETEIPATDNPQYTKFLALDKPLPRKRFLQILDISPAEDVTVETPYLLEYDKEWLAILKSTEPLMKYSDGLWLPPHKLTGDRLDFTPTEEELSEVEKLFEVEGFGKRLIIPENFTTTIPAFVEGSKTDYEAAVMVQENPQTIQFCEKMGFENPFKPGEQPPVPVSTPVSAPNPEEIDVSEDTDNPPNESPMEAGKDTISPIKQSPIEPEGMKGSLGEGLLDWSIQTTQQEPPALSPPVKTADQTDEPMDKDEATDENKPSGIKRALPVSPSTTSQDVDVGSCDPETKKEIDEPSTKRRNIEASSEETETA